MGRTKKVLSKRCVIGGIVLIFVTVGTHEQPMDRLLIELDELIEKGKIQEKVIAQIGYSNYKPQNYKYDDLISYDEMDRMVREARIIITHGGPGSIFHAIRYGKVPIVVPRDPEFNEHVDDHQILFTKRLNENNKVIAVYDIKELKNAILEYEKLSIECICDKSNEIEFIPKFENLLKERLNL